MDQQKRGTFYKQKSISELRDKIRTKFFNKLKSARQADQNKHRFSADVSETAIDQEFMGESSGLQAPAVSPVQEFETPPPNSAEDLRAALLQNRALTQNVTSETIANIGMEIRMETCQEEQRERMENVANNLQHLVDELFTTCVLCEKVSNGVLCNTCLTTYFQRRG